MVTKNRKVRSSTLNILLLLFVTTVILAFLFIALSIPNIQELVNVSETENMWEEARIYFTSKNNMFIIGIALAMLAFVLITLYYWYGKNEVQIIEEEKTPIYEYIFQEKKDKKSRNQIYEQCVNIFKNMDEYKDNIDLECTKELNKFTWESGKRK